MQPLVQNPNNTRKMLNSLPMTADMLTVLGAQLNEPEVQELLGGLRAQKNILFCWKTFQEVSGTVPAMK